MLHIIRKTWLTDFRHRRRINFDMKSCRMHWLTFSAARVNDFQTKRNAFHLMKGNKNYTEWKYCFECNDDEIRLIFNPSLAFLCASCVRKITIVSILTSKPFIHAVENFVTKLSSLVCLRGSKLCRNLLVMINKWYQFRGFLLFIYFSLLFH